eukprot:3294086-Karenia_brevis.AAC.1
MLQSAQPPNAMLQSAALTAPAASEQQKSQQPHMPSLPAPQTPAGFTLQQPPAQLPPPTTQPGQG